MRVLGIDVGIKRTGLALSDDKGISVRILPNLIANNRALAVEKLISLVKDFEIKAIVIGLPTGDSAHHKAVISRVFGLKEALLKALLEINFDVQIVLVDESYTSKLAQKRLLESGVKRDQRKIKLDGASAAIMVERYLIGNQRSD